ncbi:MAG: phosphoglycerate kinase [Holosporales bacterium]|jgi:phosphoglycerate kinase|nr:phosphoglycerate kinase [Holosporales bacterium]
MICTTFPKNACVLVRVDLNVPMHKNQVTDDTRIRLIVPTLKALRSAGNQCILMAHLGRPKGKDLSFSLQALIPTLNYFLHETVAFIPDATQVLEDIPSNAYVLLENLRFYPGEEANDTIFAQHLARLGDFYVNEAFSVSHRAHASIVGVPSYLPHAAGLLFQQELDALRQLTEYPDPPVLAIVGGNKISTKLGLLYNLLEKASSLAVGGGLANTLLAAQGYTLGRSPCELLMLDQAREFLKKAEKQACQLILPVDVVVRTEENAAHICSINDIPLGAHCLDVGPATSHQIAQEIACAGTILWNGPLGRFEEPPFHRATEMMMRAIAVETQRRKILSVIGGGDSVAALNAVKIDFSCFTYVSTSGGAFLEFLEGADLPGVRALNTQNP